MDRSWLPAIRESAKAVMARAAAPGLWLVVVDRGEIVISEALELASVVGPTPWTRDTVVVRRGSVRRTQIDSTVARIWSLN